MKTELLAWLINATIATSVAGIAILMLRKPLQRWLGAEIAYRLWIALPLAALAACFKLPQATSLVASNAPSTVVSAPALVVRATSSLGWIEADRWLLSIWTFGACALWFALVWQQRRFVARLHLRRGGDGSWRSATTDAAPAVLGVLRQKLVLPEGFEDDYSDAEQQLVIAHERMHQQRRDPWALAMCAALRTLFWFNPIVHVAAGRFRRDVETACDAAVLRTHPGSRQRYAGALLKSQVADRMVPVGCLWHHTPPMKERIMLLKQKMPTRRARLAGAILVAVASLGISGFALAGHDAALETAGALATAPVPPTPPEPPVAPAPPADRDFATPPAAPAPPAPPEVAILPAPRAMAAPPAPPAVMRLSAPRALPAPPAPPARAPTPRAFASTRPVAPPAPSTPPTPPAAAPAPPTPPALAPTPPEPPVYPKAALDRKIGGRVKLYVLVGTDGTVRHAEVVQSHPAGVFDKASLDAAKKWRFTPARNAQGEAVTAYVMIPLIFKPDDVASR